MNDGGWNGTVKESCDEHLYTKYTGRPISSQTLTRLTLIWVFHHLAQLPLKNSHQITQNWAGSVTFNIHFNPNKSTRRRDTRQNSSSGL